MTKAQADQDLEGLDRLLGSHQTALETVGDMRLHAETKVGNAPKQLVSVAGTMPQQASSKELSQLQRELTRIEEKVTAARRFYSSMIEEYEAAKHGFLPSFVARFTPTQAHTRFDLA